MRRKQRQRGAVELPKGVHRVESRGKEFFYFQAGRGTNAAGPRTRLPDDPHTPEFWQALRQAQGDNHLEVSPHTVAGAIDGYLATAAKSVGEETLYNYQRSLEIARKAWGTLPIAGVRPAHVLAIMNGLASTPGKANNFLSTLKQLSGWAITQDLIDRSLVDGVKPYKLTGGHKPWTQEQIAAAEQHLAGVVRRGIMLYLYTGQRGSDIVRLGPTYVDDGGFDMSFDRAQKKTRREVWCPILPELAAEMATWPRRPGPYVVQDSGAPYTRNLFWDHFDQARFDEDGNAKIPELANVTLHGLRCTAVIRLRQAGLSVPQISDIVGMSLATVQRYCRFADRKESGKAALLMLSDRRTAKERKL
jgi:integrase